MDNEKQRLQELESKLKIIMEQRRGLYADINDLNIAEDEISKEISDIKKTIEVDSWFENPEDGDRLHDEHRDLQMVDQNTYE